ncbi:MAG TPA: hypothetical protein VFE57_08180 [Cyclobacteriaceae bacterium]|nr:hypothetical protein [Cyclobacteriaceae bacterium]
MASNISVFFSFPKPFLQKQAKFTQRIEQYLLGRGFMPRTLGRTDYNMTAPLTAIRRLMLESNGIITVALRKTVIEKGTLKPESDLDVSADVSGQWLTSPWCHIEVAMAYQIGLPILIFREKGVTDDGILQKGISGVYLPEFDLSSEEDYLESDEWKQIIGEWEGYVRTVVSNKGRPPKLF